VEALDEAMTALRRAKSRGPGSVVEYDVESFQASMRRYLIEHGLGSAVPRHELTLRYQPELDLRTGTVVGAEALVRWRNRRLGDVSPAEFIPVAETTGLVEAIGSWVLETAAKQWAAWRTESPRAVPTVWINLSAAQLATAERLVDSVERVLDEYGLPPESFGVEVTETAVLADMEASRLALGRLRDRGIGVAVDDFGSGYASFTYLRHLPATRLKIDRSLVIGVGGSRPDTSIVEAVIDLGHTLSLEVVAEGVETELQASTLMRLGADSAQGFLFAPALEAEAFALKARRAWAGAELSVGTVTTPRPAVLPGVARGRGSLLVAALEAAPDGMVLIDANRVEPVVVYANRRAEAVTGLAWHQLTGRLLRSVLPSDAAVATARSGDAGSVEVLIAHPRLGTRVLELRLGAGQDSQALPGHRVGILRDVTESRVLARAVSADQDLVHRAGALAGRLAGGEPLRGEAVRAAVAAAGALLGAAEARLELAGDDAVVWRRPGTAAVEGAELEVPVHAAVMQPGRLWLRRSDARAWRPAEIAAARLVADGVGTAVVGARPVVDLRRRTAFEGFRQRLARQALSAGPGRDGFTAACRELAGLLGATSAWVEILDVDTGGWDLGGSWPVTTGTSMSPLTVQDRSAAVTGRRGGLQSALVAAPATLCWDGGGTAPSWTDDILVPPTPVAPRSVVVVPMRVAGRLVGMLGITAGVPRRWAHEDLTLAVDAAGTMASAVAHLRQERQLRVVEERFRMLAEHASDMISLADEDGVLRYVSRASMALLGRPADTLLGKHIFDLVHPEDLPAVKQEMHRSARDRCVVRCLARIARLDAGWVWVETMIQPQVDAGGHVRGWHATSRDVTERRRFEEGLARMALHDSLTGLANRVLLVEHLQASIERLERAGVPFALVAVDLDGFKAVNDNQGHQSGDQALQIVAKRLLQLMRQTDFVARVGGDEFVILCNDTDAAGAALVGERIVHKVSEPLSLSTCVAQIGASVGIVQGETGQSRDELLRRADQAMYRAKRAGKGQVSIFAG
jgi:diguanylate cyclase (GGDEF)-like protein/PAS domain S-box-containing protein